MAGRPTDAALHQIYEREVAWYRGVLLPGVRGRSALFDGPARAVQCAAAVTAACGPSGVGAGVHIGEVDPSADDGPVVTVSRSLASQADGGVLVTRAVVDLVPGSGLQFDERGTIRDAANRPLPVMALRR